MLYVDAAKVLTTTAADPGAAANAIAARVLQSAVVGSGATVSIDAGSGGQVSRARFQQGMKRRNVARGFIPVSNAIYSKLKAEMKEEIDYNVSVFSTQGVIYLFRGFWPSLPQLHFWI
ncbi:hypothetical protein SUGI_0397850 [Cryptomeria japonica]|nr:hypothetical protein SUGI_0397850 [Cryptomeria japonica]